MSKVQELDVIDASIKAPRKLQVIAYYLMNRSIHRLVECLSELTMWGSVASTNNSRTAVGARDKSEFKQSWANYKIIKKSVKENHTSEITKNVKATQNLGVIENLVKLPAPDGEYETHIAILVPSAYEKLRYLNSCWKQPILEVFNLIDVYLSSGDRGLPSEITQWADINAAEVAVDQAISDFLDSNYVPTRKVKLGFVTPPLNFEYEKIIEPGAGRQQLGLPDAQDVDIIGSKVLE